MVQRVKASGAETGEVGTASLPASEYVQTLEKGLAVIKTFNEKAPTRTLAEVATVLGFTRAAARRFVLTLEALGYIERTGKAFRLTPQVLELGYSYLASLPWWRHAQTVVDRLAQELGCGCAAGVLDRDCVAYVAYASGEPSSSAIRSVGTRLPAHATAMGRVLLAHLDEDSLYASLQSTHLDRLTPRTEQDADRLVQELLQVRELGYAIVDQQLEMGLFSIGVPIRDRSGLVFAGLSASSRRTSMSEGRLVADYLDLLKAAAQRITAGLPS